MADIKKKYKTIPLAGKYMTHDPATIGSNFQTLTNMRYEDTHPKSVAGNTKINTTALTTYLKIRNAYHFKKFQPAESHLLVQAYNTGLTASQILQNTTAIPSAGDFSATALWTDSAGAIVGTFCDTSDGQMVYANGVDTCMWGGTEMKVGAVITSTAVVGDDGSATEPKDITDIMQNTKTDSENVTHIGGGIDSYTELCIHFDGADADTADQTAATGQTVSLEGNACLDTAYRKFGSASLLLDGTGDYCTVPDSADWDFGTGNFTIDLWMTHTAAPTGGICGQYVDDNNYWYFGTVAGALYFKVVIGAATKADYSWSESYSTGGTFYHVELARTSTTMDVWINGTKLFGASKTESTAIGANSMPTLAAALDIGREQVGADTYLEGWIDELRISKGIARHSDLIVTVPATQYTDDWRYLLIGSPRPLQGMKVYISTANTVASTLTCKEWNGTTWNSLTITDNTDTGASLAQTGTITFSSTVDTSKPRYLAGYFMYWYQLYLDAGEAEIYQITLDAPFQSIIDLWDGVFRDISACYNVIGGNYNNVTLDCLRSDYDSTDTATYCDISSMAAFSDPNNCLEIGFAEKMTGLYFEIPPDQKNTTAATTMSVDYWNGAAYVTVGAVSDGTSTGAIAFSNSGIVTWNNIDISDETKCNKSNQIDYNPAFTPAGGTINKTTPYYFYRVRFDKAMDASVRIDYIGGITHPIEISHYKFPVFAQGRVLLCCDMAGEKNKVVCSSKWMPQVYNGEDTAEIYLGDEQELNCGIEVFSQYGGNLYSMILMFKDTETWVIAGQDITQWGENSFPLSNSIGCPAPKTLKAITLSQEPSIGVNRSLCIWQGSNGIYMSDGRAPIPIHDDIKEYFDKNNSICIKASKVGDSVGFVDSEKLEYHWLFASGTSTTTLNKELVYDIKRGKWFEIDRDTGMYLQCGCSVQDTDGNQYTYGFIDTGYCERLEYGTDFDGNAITSTMQIGDYLPEDTIMAETMIDKVKLITMAKTTTTNTISATHYGDSYTTGTSLKDCFDPTHTGYRLAEPYITDNLGGYTFHSLKFSMETSDETTGFEPLALGIAYHVLREA